MFPPPDGPALRPQQLLDLLRPTAEWCPASERSKIKMPTNGSAKEHAAAENPSFEPEK